MVARDIAHAKIKDRLDAGEAMPQYMLDHPVYYAGPVRRRQHCTPTKHTHAHRRRGRHDDV